VIGCDPFQAGLDAPEDGRTRAEEDAKGRR
jgi:hypothetical protein